MSLARCRKSIMNRRGSSALDVLLMVVIGLGINCMGIGDGPLAGTEGQRALTAHQMAQSGQWLLPRLYDQIYLAKPPLQYWILAGLEKLMGHGGLLVWRLPSAMAGATMAGFLYLMGRLWFGRLAGLVSGIGSCGLVALWGQNHTAEIDAALSLCTVASACLLIHLEFTGGWRRRVACVLVAGLAFGASLLLKGPASLAAIVGALAGPAIFNRTFKPLKQPWPWIALAVGTAMFAAYALAAVWEFHHLHLRLETSGVREIWINLFVDHNTGNPLRALALPAVLLMYAMPVSLFVPMALRRPLWSGSGETQRLVRALVGTVTVACGLTMVCGMWNPRYSYTWLPLICPVAGAVAAAWQRGLYGKKDADFLYMAVGAVGIVLTIWMIVMAGVCLRDGAGHAAIIWSRVAIAAALAGMILRWIRRNRPAWVVAAMVAILLLAGKAYGVAEAADRQRRSGQQCAEAVAQNVPAGQTVVTGRLILDQPEIFYYAGLKVESYPNASRLPRRFATSRWVLLDSDEYSAWSRALGAAGRLIIVRRIQGRHISAVLARYVSKNEAKSLAAQ
jgi:4-amino-4-deoxy-L-arabinose transferase-like glycosyltransferase